MLTTTTGERSFFFSCLLIFKFQRIYTSNHLHPLTLTVMASISSYSLFSPAWSSSSSNATSTPIPKLVPTWFPHPSTFLRLSYPTHLHTTDFLPDSQHYDKGWLDIAFVIGWTIIFAIVREISM